MAIVEALRGYAHGGDRKSDRDRKCDVDHVTVARAAQLVGDSRDDYFRARSVVERGVPELVQAMDSGAISVSAAAEIARVGPEVQRAVVSRPGHEAAWAAREVRHEKRRLHDGRGRDAPVGGPWTITSDRSVIPCNAVITDPLYGVTMQGWDRDIERTTRARASSWNGSGALWTLTPIESARLRFLRHP